MAFYYQQDFPTVQFRTFKPVPPNEETPENPTLCHAELSPPAEPKMDPCSKNKDIPASSTNSAVPKEIPRKPGTTLKDQTYQWFEKTQRRKLVRKGQFPDWFHGFVTRTRAEEMLHDKPLGCFLVRFCESRVGFVLSYRGTERCRHFKLDQQEDEQYLIEGEKSTHPQLEDLIQHYSMFPVEPFKEMLTTPCSKKHNSPTGLSDNSSDAATGGQMYGRITKHTKVSPDTVPLLSTSPKDKEKRLSEGQMPVEIDSSSFVEKATVFLGKEPLPSPEVHEDSIFAYTSVNKPSRNHKGGKDEQSSPRTLPDTSPEFHTYTEPALWSTPLVDIVDSVHDPIAFYAMGRGSCSDNTENVYSEVDIHSMTPRDLRAGMDHKGFATISHPSRKPFEHKTSAFHSSIRLHSRSPTLQEGISSKHFSKSKKTGCHPIQSKF
ncbi:SH2 domain-containing protein 2A isoform X2 [Mixophyes fleayi]|uniref:SH2 domain-containing protein 2A isoform X2 n=1 Tax=Mixophyes fleayi TaxID=3061075 RepID=UPI003F4D71D3